jgi:hypothetical protein
MFPKIHDLEVKSWGHIPRYVCQACYGYSVCVRWRYLLTATSNVFIDINKNIFSPKILALKCCIFVDRHVCEKCGKRYKSIPGLKDHQARDHETTRYTCGQCQQGFLSKTLFKWRDDTRLSLWFVWQSLDCIKMMRSAKYEFYNKTQL